jgi:hypothetical protein
VHRRRNACAVELALNAAIAARDDPSYMPVGLYA